MANEERDLEKREAELPVGVERTTQRRQYVPIADIYETNERVVVLADLPGVAAGGLDITLEQNVLTIQATVAEERPPDMKCVYAEYENGDFYRAFSLSEEIDRDGIEAELSNGVLTLVLPKARPTRRRIAVKSD